MLLLPGVVWFKLYKVGFSRKPVFVAVNPKLINNKANFLLKIRLNFPDLSIQKIKKKLDQEKYFYLKKRLDQNDKKKLWALEEKGSYKDASPSFSSRYSFNPLFLPPFILQRRQT